MAPTRVLSWVGHTGLRHSLGMLETCSQLTLLGTYAGGTGGFCSHPGCPPTAACEEPQGCSFLLLSSWSSLPNSPIPITILADFVSTTNTSVFFPLNET